jgi:serine/arginine repetitive matrix protein 2
MTTPGSGRRKNVLRVRFDVESESSAVENIDDRLVESSPPTPLNGVSASADSVHDTDEAVLISNEQIDRRPHTPETPATPVSCSPRSPRKSPGIRVVDAFGREQVSNERDDSEMGRLSPSASAKKPRSNHAVRIVDAMGREVKEAPEPSPESKSDDDPQLSRNEALTRLKQGILDLADGLSDADR